ncbi:MAG: sigma-54-dependent Fis family transcriptional regulator [Acidobacteria bacterium]|nr:MAG: sigma-54-dependent Fis family transcriptional regulator [Acidobacteriota bacterium]
MSVVDRSAAGAQGEGRIVLVDDDDRNRDAMEKALRRGGYEVASFGDGAEALAYVRNHPDVELIVTDLRMPGMDGLELLRRVRDMVPDIGVLMITAFASEQSFLEAMKYGAEDYLEKPVNLGVMRARVANLVKKVRLSRQLDEYRAIEETLSEEGSFEGMIGRSGSMLELFRKIRQVAPARSSVLIVGESGTGKELVARAIHRHSPRARETFLPVDCAAIPSEMLESELFGHEKGAFTGAQARKPGKFELADGGTLFLDEIGELPLGLQSKLLRVLETQTFMRVGGTSEVKVDVRVLAATNRDLAAMAERGEFRHDLYYRLAVVTLKIPPLRERPDDIPLLATAFLERMAVENDRKPPRLTPEAMELLRVAPWPGNVRELRNMMESLVILHAGEEIRPSHLPEELRRMAREPARASSPMGIGLAGRTMEEIEREAILHTLEKTGGNRTQAAEMLGIGLRTLQRKLKQYRKEGHPVADPEPGGD